MATRGERVQLDRATRQLLGPIQRRVAIRVPAIDQCDDVSPAQSAVGVGESGIQPDREAVVLPRGLLRAPGDVTGPSPGPQVGLVGTEVARLDLVDPGALGADP